VDGASRPGWKTDAMTEQMLPAAGNYTLDPGQTTIRCDCKAMFGLLTVHGTFQLGAGQVSITDDPAAATVSATIMAGSYQSGNGKRDSDVVSSTLLDAKAYPDITFTGSGARREGTDWVVTGSVTAHGSTQPAAVHITEVSPAGGPGAIRFHATAALDRTSFGVTRQKGMVGRTVHLIIDATAIPS
jgi:polyisoprenoid-binding protein YceI